MTKPRFEVIKNHILKNIETSTWKPGDAIPSENQLAEQFSVSRMTARRAVTELTSSGVLDRIQGAGTYVAEQLPTGSLLEIQTIAREIALRGHTHHAEVIDLGHREVDHHIQSLLRIAPNQRCAYSRVLHFENGIPIQLEERYINSLLVPDYLDQDFSQVTPSEYLSSVTPLSEADHWIEAVICPDDIQHLLQIDHHTPCLKISRRTYTRRGSNHHQDNARPHSDIVNFAFLYHPGDRYRLGGHLNF